MQIWLSRYFLPFLVRNEEVGKVSQYFSTNLSDTPPLLTSCFYAIKPETDEETVVWHFETDGGA